MRIAAVLCSALFLLCALWLLQSEDTAEAATVDEAFIWLPRTTCNFVKTPSEEFEILLNITWSGAPASVSDLEARLEYTFDDKVLNYTMDIKGFKASLEPGLWALRVSAPTDAIPGLIYDLQVDIGEDTALTEPRCVQIIRAYKTELKVMHLTDVHIDYADSNIMGPTMPSAREMMAKVIDEVNLLDPDLILVTGDLVFRGYGAGVGPDILEQFRMYREAMSGLNAPVCTCIGNHEVEWNPDVEGTTRNYVENIGPLHWGFDYGNVHFILLNSTTDYWQDSRLEGGFSDTEIDWCSSRLDAIPAGELTIVGFHHDYGALVRGGSEEMKALLGGNCDKVKFVLTGHSHNEGLDEASGVKYLQTLSCGENDGDGENGYRILTVSSGVVTDYAYAETVFGSIPYNMLNSTITPDPSEDVAASILIENHLLENFTDCTFLLYVGADKDVTAVNCTVEEVISSSSRTLLELGFQLSRGSSKTLRLDYKEAPDDDVAPDDDIDDDVTLDDDADDDNVTDDDTVDDDGDDLDDDTNEDSGNMTLVWVLFAGIIALMVILVVIRIAVTVSRRRR